MDFKSIWDWFEGHTKAYIVGLVFCFPASVVQIYFCSTASIAKSPTLVFVCICIFYSFVNYVLSCIYMYIVDTLHEKNNKSKKGTKQAKPEQVQEQEEMTATLAALLFYISTSFILFLYLFIKNYYFQFFYITLFGHVSLYIVLVLVTYTTYKLKALSFSK